MPTAFLCVLRKFSIVLSCAAVSPSRSVKNLSLLDADGKASLLAVGSLPNSSSNRASSGSFPLPFFFFFDGVALVFFEISGVTTLAFGGEFTGLAAFCGVVAFFAFRFFWAVAVALAFGSPLGLFAFFFGAGVAFLVALAFADLTGEPALARERVVGAIGRAVTMVWDWLVNVPK